MQEELLNKYLESLGQRISRIDSLLEKLAEGNVRADENVRLIAHSLHGSGASFGFPEISAAAELVEHATSEEISDRLVALKAVIETVLVANQSVPAASEPVKEQVPQKAANTKTPESPKPVTPPVQQAEKPAKARQISILVVDDDPSICDHVVSALDALPKKPSITVVNNAARAQEAIVKQAFDLIIMDLVLPDRDGRELIQEIKLEFQIGSPVLVLSAIQNDTVRVECMSLGADKFITKPFYDDDLLGAVKKLLGKQDKASLSLVPKGDELLKPAEPGKPASPKLRGKSILVAEDDKFQAEMIQQRLTMEGATVKVANNGREAMQLLRMQEFSLIILDGKMPIMDGFEVLQRIQQELKLDVPVIMVTAMGSEEDIIRGYDLGATDYILKPFSEVLLVARVKSLLKPGS